MTKKLLLAIFISIVLWVSGDVVIAETTKTAVPDTLSVDEIVNRTNRVAYYLGSDGSARVKMTITDSQGRQRNRELSILRWDQPNPDLSKEQQGKDDSYCGGQKTYAFFHRPADVSKTVFMVWKYPDKDDDRWMYLPALDLVKRIAATDKRTSFMGSNFFYEDVSGRSPADDTHELVETTKDYYVLKNTPKDSTLVEFSYFKMWIHRESFVVVKTDYYDKQGKKYRTYEALNVENIQGYPTVTKAKMTDLRTGGYTVSEYSQVKYDIGIPESIFTERYLRKPPRKYLK
ncbi:MAG: outer membrane lipoprotein-sorting protein [Planctomycetales bacterium 4572_13]|nr:MAG: outer membrane lipoprotein-sorting protein [Planctomycetales bacterium 4572_13]